MNRTALALLLCLAAGRSPSAQARAAGAADTGAPTDTAAPLVTAGELGRIDFPNSGAPAAQEPFLRGVLLLHSFEYEDAAEAFREAQALDPTFALAYWGEALTHCHPIWNEDAPEEARAVLARLAPSPAERLAKAPGERERGLCAALEVLWGEGSRLERNRAYALEMEALHARFPDDHEIAAFTSIAILGSSGARRDIPVYMRAAAIAEQVYEANPDHPGAIHYAIHAYDDAVHAPLGLRMANRYAAVAPAAAHALHMPSHIYVALGLWRESVATNVRSMAAADARRARKSLGIDARGFHSLAWRAYSELQLGHVAEARALLAEVERDVREDPTERVRSHLAIVRAAHLVDAGGLEARGQEDVLALEVDRQDLRLETAVADLFITGACAARRGELERARAALAAIDAALASDAAEVDDPDGARACCRVESGGYGAASPERAGSEAMRQELIGLLALARGESAAGLAALREAARLEDDMGLDFGPPIVVKPAHELLGEALLATGDAAGARQEFEAALARAPRRARALLGLARALQATGDAARSAAVYAELAEMWSAADPDLAELAEVRAAAAARTGG